MGRFSSSRVTDRLPTFGGGGVAAIVAVVLLAMPGWRLEPMVEASGLAAMLPGAAPPLGSGARALLVLGVGAVSGATIWSSLYLLWGRGGWLIAPTGAPTVRRADAHPDAPPRWPLTAAELGVPPPPPEARAIEAGAIEAEATEVEQALPADLDQPIAAFDPFAIPLDRRAPIRPAPIAPQDARIETFELTPMVRNADPAPAGDARPSIEALFQRLERSASRRNAAAR